MEIIRKRGGGLDPIHNFEAHCFASRVKEFLCKIEGYGHLWALFLSKYFK